MKVVFERVSAGSNTADCNLCKHSDLCKFKDIVETIPLGRPYKIEFECGDYEQSYHD